MEMLVALALLVIIVGLAAFLYARAARIRKLITYQNDVQNVLNSIITEINFGSRDTIGLQYAHDIWKDANNTFYQLGFYDRVNEETVFYRISPGMESGEPSTTGVDTTIWQAKTRSSGIPNKWTLIDVNRSIVLVSGTGFTYYVPSNSGPIAVDNLDVDTPIIAVKIVLRGMTTDPSLKTRPVITATTLVRPKNKPPFYNK